MVATEHYGISRGEAAKLSRRRALAISTEGVFLIFFVVGLAWVPFWFGSNRPIPWAINAAIFPGLAALYELSLVVRGVPHPIAIRRIGVSAAMFAMVVIWILVQSATWTPAGWQHPIWQLASDALGEPVPGSISADRDLTATALLRLLTAASTFWLALQLSEDVSRARLLLWSVVAISAVYAAAGIFALGFLPHGRIFSELPAIKVTTSTFVNQNHYATFAGIGLVTCVGGILRLYRRELSRSGRLWGMKIAALINVTGTQAALPLAFAAAIATSVLLTGSRGGIAATALGLLALFALNVRKTAGSYRNDVLLLLFATLLVAGTFYTLGDAFVGRVAEQGLSDPGRPAVLILSIKSILSAPLLGYGYGTFEAVFPMFRDDSLSVNGLWDKAHDTYLEVFQGLGLLFGWMLLACVAMLVWQCLKVARTRKRNATIPAIAASVSVLVGAHAFLDFSLQLQAVTLTYMAVLGAGVSQAFDPTSKVSSSVWSGARSEGRSEP
ncbi:MAG TPA: O-antigen ligase family protein [Myxococcaceae bacterium]|nr:O-antigen ligase family protein [Myxococcaceae bacterium]